MESEEDEQEEEQQEEEIEVEEEEQGEEDLDPIFNHMFINFIFPEQPKPTQKVTTKEVETIKTTGTDKTVEIPVHTRTETLTFTKIFESLEELITLGETYEADVRYISNIDMKKLHDIVEPLKELNSMIGLNDFKKNILDQIVYILTTDFTDRKEVPMLHSCIYGVPGIGKTTCAEILAKIYSACGILTVGGVKIAKREDFVGEFLGHTSVKTKKLLDSCKGKVLFIDEAYSFGSSESTNKDMFAKEAVDCLNVFLSENYRDFICIIAGYKEQVDKCFFSINEGLRRRFTNFYTLDSYSGPEMSSIFLKFVRDENWSLDMDTHILTRFFTEHRESFPYYGGDIKTLLDKCKIVHARKNVILDKSLWKVLDRSDMEEGFLVYLEDRTVEKDEYITSMYM